MESADGPAVKIWVWIDNFIIHGLTFSKTTAALKSFLDLMVKIEMLCHPKKFTLPAKIVKYCGFLFYTTGMPCLCIPVVKRERALAIAKQMANSAPHQEWSRLSLAVAAGMLESLVEATPRRIGHTYLRRFHSVVHRPGIGTGAKPFHMTTTVPANVRQDLHWWITYLEYGKGHFARSIASTTLVPAWGDGSGTGTGGTFTVPDGPLKMWKGKWSPCLYQVNWKEVEILKLALERLLEEDNLSVVQGTTVFYFTDNSTVYWITSSGSYGSPRLNVLIDDIWILESRLGCHLQVVHVPGIVMFSQGTDGPNQGIWMTTLQGLADPRRLTQAVFHPLTFDRGLVLPFVQHLQDQGQPTGN